MSTMLTPNPMLSPTPTGQGQVSAPPTDNPNYAVAPVPAFTLPAHNMLPSQINFGSAPAGAPTDAQYLAQQAALRQQIGEQYAGVLSHLGYGDSSTGAVIPGYDVQDANIKMSGYLRDLQNQQIDESRQAQDTGTATSGLRALELARAQAPIYQNIGALELGTGRGLNDLYNQAQGLVAQYNTQDNSNLAAAAARHLTALQNTTGGPPPIHPTSGLVVAGANAGEHIGVLPHQVFSSSPQSQALVPAMGTDALHGHGAYTPSLVAPRPQLQTPPVSGYSALSGSGLH